MQSSKDYVAAFREDARRQEVRFHAGSDDLARGEMLTEHPDTDWTLYRIDKNERWPVFKHSSKEGHRIKHGVD
jgi:hypothetical protein